MQDLDERLSAIRQRDEMASRVPWTIEQRADGTRFVQTSEPSGRDRLIIKSDADLARKDDVRFIVMARNILPRLITAIETREFDLVSGRELAEIEQVAAATFPATWNPFLEEDGGLGGCSMIQVETVGFGRDMYVWMNGDIAPDADIRLIGDAREDVPYLIEAFRRLRGE